jgi:thiol-disulfide isomerase/thioredoxin
MPKKDLCSFMLIAVLNIFALQAWGQDPRFLWAEAARAQALPLFGTLKVSYLGFEKDDTVRHENCKVYFQRNKKFKLERYKLEPNPNQTLYYLNNEFLWVSHSAQTIGRIATENAQIPETEDMSFLLYKPFFEHDNFFGTQPDATFEYLGKQSVGSVLCDVVKIVQHFVEQELKVEKKVFIEPKTRMVWGYEDKSFSGKYQRFEQSFLSEMDLTTALKGQFDLSSLKSYQQKDEDFGLEVGQKAPDLVIKTTSDKTFRVSDFLGKVVVLDFWYFSCAPCRLSTPFLDEMYQKNKSRGLEVLGINAYDKDKKLIDDFEAQYKVRYGLFESSSKSLRLYQVNSFPTFWVLDKEGNVAAKFEGYSKSNMKFLQQTVEELLSK